jgi:hypothetical protein
VTRHPIGGSVGGWNAGGRQKQRRRDVEALVWVLVALGLLLLAWAVVGLWRGRNTWEDYRER